MRAPSDEHRYFVCLGSIVQSCPFNLNFCFECHPELIETYYTRRSTRHRREGKFRCDFCFEQQLNPLKYIKKHHLVAIVGKKQVLDLEPSGVEVTTSTFSIALEHSIPIISILIVTIGDWLVMESSNWRKVTPKLDFPPHNMAPSWFDHYQKRNIVALDVFCVYKPSNNTPYETFIKKNEKGEFGLVWDF